MRILVRVPEAYLLLSPYATQRPGLLILDADGRRVDSIKLPGRGIVGEDKPTVAARLKAGIRREALEVFRTTVAGTPGCMAKVRNDVLKWEGVRSADLKGNTLTVRGTAGSLVPEKLVALAKSHVVHLEVDEPVEVNLDWPEGEAAMAAAAATKLSAFSGIPGVWYTGRRRSFQTYVTSLLLQPDRLALNGLVPDVEARAFDLPGIPKGGGGAGVAKAPLAVDGVVSVFPDIFNNGETVIGRKDEVDWEDVLDAFRATGVRAKPK